MSIYKTKRRNVIERQNVLKGGKLSVSHIESFLNDSYEPNPKQRIDNFELVDKTETTRTYWNGTQCVFVVRGTNPTMTDWKNNINYMMGSYKSTPRFKEAFDAYQKAVNKYGEKNISIVGHSQGSIFGSLFPNAKESITLNRAYKGESIPPNEYDIHATRDVVSALLNIKKPPHDIPIKSVSFNPITNHSIDILKLLEPSQMIGMNVKPFNHSVVEGRNPHDNGLTDKQIKLLCDYFNINIIGVFEKNEIKSLEFGNYIVNLNGQSHWCSMIISPNGNFWFDSYGFIAPENLQNLMENYIWNDKQIQDINSTSCGYYCIAFLKFMKSPSNKSYLQFTDLFNTPKKNDKILFSLLS